MFFKRKKINTKAPKALYDIQFQPEQCAIIEDVRKYVLSHCIWSNIHGLSHWQNVAANGLILAKYTGANPFVTQLFAYLHDSCRVDDSDDLEHGLKASDLTIKLKDTLLKAVTEQEFEQLYLACKHHTTTLRLGDSTIDTCFDADRLDLVRLGITLDPNLMATKAGAYWAKNYCIRR